MRPSTEVEKLLNVTHVSNEKLWKPAHDEVCIYRVPDVMRNVPEIYTPQAVIIGPRHHSKKQEAVRMEEEIPTTAEIEQRKHRYKRYLDMEMQKQIYFREFGERVGVETVERFKSYIESKEQRIRRCYAESTTWIKTPEFVDMILLDAIFIMELLLKTLSDAFDRRTLYHQTLHAVVYEDLFFLLENQLPCFILEHLGNMMLLSFRKLCLRLVSLLGITMRMTNIPESETFMHFTDLLRLTIKTSLGIKHSGKIDNTWQWHLYSAEKLQDSGVDLVLMDEEKKPSMSIEFENKQLRMGCFVVQDSTELMMRNVIALEQCHYPNEIYVCYYMLLLNFLIETSKDEDLLVEKGIVKSISKKNSVVVDIVKRLVVGTLVGSSCYSDIAQRLNAHYESSWNRTVAKLRRVYFNDLWTGTATVAAVILLALGVIQAATSILQLRK